LHHHNSAAFYTIEDVRETKEGVFRKSGNSSVFSGIAALVTKSK